MRYFDTGATRDTDEAKLDFEGFLSPETLEAFAKYMHKHRKQADGKLRDSDNWQKGIPFSAYMKSKWRHFFDTWKFHRQGRELSDEMIDALCAEWFNVQGYLHELLKERHKQDLERIFTTLESVNKELQQDGQKTSKEETGPQQAVQNDNDRRFPRLCEETCQQEPTEIPEGYYVQFNGLLLPVVYIRNQRIPPEAPQADGLSDSEGCCGGVSEEQANAEITCCPERPYFQEEAGFCPVL